jgi:predicted hotdog family 3-hydroxylacyl-ACP dehydratase
VLCRVVILLLHLLLAAARVEVLRWEDYSAGVKNANSAPAPAAAVLPVGRLAAHSGLLLLAAARHLVATLHLAAQQVSATFCCYFVVV